MRKHGFDSRQGRMSVDYLNLARAQDLKNPKERALYRFFEIIPGFLSLGTLGLVFILSWLTPVVIAIFIIVFDLYWLFRITYLAIHQIACYRKMKENLKVDWLAKLKKFKNWQDIYHLVILPFYKEEIGIVRATLQSLVDAEYPKEKMIVVLTAEERGGEETQKTAKQIEKEFGESFFRFLRTTHPQNLPGEIPGKGSNEAWAVNQARELIINKLSIPPENVIVSGFDVDTRPFPKYFSCLTWHYLTGESPLRSSYQPIPVYNNNIWDVPAFSRVIATSGTFWQMMQQERPEQLVTYSTHSMPLKLFEEVEYPVNLMSVNDDSHIFWKAYLHYDGDYKVIPLHYPVSMDAVTGKNLLKTAANQYKQQRRWAFGCSEIPYVLYGFFKNKKILLKEKLRHSFILFDGFWSWATTALLIFFLGWLPLMLGGERFNITLLSYNLPRLTGQIMTAAMIGMVTSAIISMLLLPPKPPRYSKWKNPLMVLQWILLPITLIIFGNFPALDAQVRLLLGKYFATFWVTEKARK